VRPPDADVHLVLTVAQLHHAVDDAARDDGLGRVGLAQVITFLASPAAAYLTGTTVAADGGRTAI
jgi:NAD(P)-dependent dehydrogenase (short-subunit alcohol dehydrogenase family)